MKKSLCYGVLFCFATFVCLAHAQESSSISKHLFDGQGAKVALPGLFLVGSGVATLKENKAKEQSGFSKPVLVGEPLKAYVDADPGLTKYQILQKLYNDASSPALETDFDDYDQVNNQYCVQANINDPNYLGQEDIKHVIKVTDAAGPLFPEKRQKKLFVFSPRNSWNWQLIFDLITVSTVGKDLVWHSDYVTKFGSPATANFRKDSSLIFFFEKDDEGTPKATTSYGYCWRDLNSR